MLKYSFSKQVDYSLATGFLGPESSQKGEAGHKARDSPWCHQMEYQFLANSFPGYQPAEITSNCMRIVRTSVSDCCPPDPVCLSNHFLTLFVGDCSSDGDYKVMA